MGIGNEEEDEVIKTNGSPSGSRGDPGNSTPATIDKDEMEILDDSQPQTAQQYGRGTPTGKTTKIGPKGQFLSKSSLKNRLKGKSGVGEESEPYSSPNVIHRRSKNLTEIFNGSLTDLRPPEPVFNDTILPSGSGMDDFGLTSHLPFKPIRRRRLKSTMNDSQPPSSDQESQIGEKHKDSPRVVRKFRPKARSKHIKAHCNLPPIGEDAQEQSDQSEQPSEYSGGQVGQFEMGETKLDLEPIQEPMESKADGKDSGVNRPFPENELGQMELDGVSQNGIELGSERIGLESGTTVSHGLVSEPSARFGFDPDTPKFELMPESVASFGLEQEPAPKLEFDDGPAPRLALDHMPEASFSKSESSIQMNRAADLRMLNQNLVKRNFERAISMDHLTPALVKHRRLRRYSEMDIGRVNTPIKTIRRASLNGNGRFHYKDRGELDFPHYMYVRKKLGAPANRPAVPLPPSLPPPKPRRVVMKSAAGKRTRQRAGPPHVAHAVVAPLPMIMHRPTGQEESDTVGEPPKKPVDDLRPQRKQPTEEDGFDAVHVLPKKPVDDSRPQRKQATGPEVLDTVEVPPKKPVEDSRPQRKRSMKKTASKSSQRRPKALEKKTKSVTPKPNSQNIPSTKSRPQASSVAQSASVDPTKRRAQPKAASGQVGTVNGQFRTHPSVKTQSGTVTPVEISRPRVENVPDATENDEEKFDEFEPVQSGSKREPDTISLVGRPRGFVSNLLQKRIASATPNKNESSDSGVATTDESNSSHNSSSSSSPPTGPHNNGKSTRRESLKPVPEESETDSASTMARKKSLTGSVISDTRTMVSLGNEDRISVSYADRDDISAKLLAAGQKGQWNVVDELLRTADKDELNMSMTEEHGMTTLMLAVKDNRISIVEKLLEFGADLEDRMKDGRTVAHVAAMYARDDMMRYLIFKKVDVFIPAGSKHQTPLHMASARPSVNALPIVQLLLRTANMAGQFEERHVEDKNGCNSLLLACESGILSVAKELVSVQGEKQARLRRKDTGDTGLHFACKRKDHELAKLLLANGAQVNVQNNMGRTPLHVVAEEGDEAMLRIFYQHKADANISDKEDKTPLHIAAEKGYTTVVEILADKFKASVLARTKDGSTLMHIASQFGHSDTAMAFLKRGVPLHMPNKSGALGLHMAAALGHVDVVKTLLQKGTQVNVRTKDNYTALHVAVQAGKPGVVETLLGYGADVHVKGGRKGETALHVAASLDGPNSRFCAEMLLKSGADPNMRLENGETALHMASKRGNTIMVKLLLDDDAEPTATSKVGESPLHVAAVNCHYKACKMLLEYVEHSRRREEAANLVNLQTIEGETAMHYAAEITKDAAHFTGEDVRLVELLLDYGGEVNIQTQLTGEIVMHYCSRSGNEAVLAAIVSKIGPGGVQLVLNKQDKSGWSPLMEACAKGNLAIVRILLQYHARVDVFDEHGKTALHLAAENGHVEICDILLRNKAFINSKTKLGVTPLHLACMQGHPKVVTLLVERHKASTDATTSEGQTPLHLAAQTGQLGVCNTLISLGANANAKDARGQTPLHLAAESDHPDVVKLFLKLKPDLSTLTATDENGFTCAHIAAMKGSVAVIKELMLIDKTMVIEAKTKNTESTTLHMAAAGGHRTVVKILLNAGASATDENSSGMTSVHLIARYGHVHLLDVFDMSLMGKCGRKTGLNPMHVAAFFGQMDFVRAILREVSATCRSEPPTNFNPLITKELSQEYGLTPLHMAAQSGHEGLVRMLLNQSGVQVDASTATMGVVPLHLAAQSGHIAVVGLLLSRSTTQLHIKDSRGRTGLHLAASQGHYEMVSLLIAQGSNINALDQNGWTPLHFATTNGHTQVVKLLLESNADPMAETRDGKVPLCFAASSNQEGALTCLMHHTHDTYHLMEDRKFVYDLMVCGKSHQNRPVEEFILLSPAPIDTAVKMSALYNMMASKEKERARDLNNIAHFCQSTAGELLSIISSEYKPAILLKAKDTRHRPFIDVLIENDQKEVVSHPAVQSYLTEVWSGGIEWGLGKFALFFLIVLFCPPAWIFFSLPLTFRVSEAPVIKFICHLVSHIYFTVLLILETLGLVQKIYEVNTFWPHWLEWVLLLWLSGLLVDELNNAGDRSGIGFVRLIIVFLSAMGVIVHIMAFIYPNYLMDGTNDEKRKMMQTLLYIKNQFFAFCLLLACIRYLEFLTVHHLFGPWAIIIRDLMYDMARFLVILTLFMAGFTLHVTSIFQPAFAPVNDQGQDLMQLMDPAQSLEMLYFSLFGIVDPTNMPPLHLVPDVGRIMLKSVYGLFLMVILVVLINLLIAMMSDTYQRIQMQSDIEWKFGRAKLIRTMNKKSAVPAPVNIFTKVGTIVRVAWRHKGNICNQVALDDIDKEENMDAYSMRGQAGRVSPVGGIDRMEQTEAGTAIDWNLETAISWKRIVDLFFAYRGEKNENGKESKGNEEAAFGL